MEDLKSQAAKSVLLLLFLLFMPLVPPSFKPSYLYFLINSLIIVLRADAGFIGEEKKMTAVVGITTAAPPVVAELSTLREEGRAEVADDENINGIEEAEEEDVDGELSEEELFTRAEAFIDNFYKQLEMQRTEGVQLFS